VKVEPADAFKTAINGASPVPEHIISHLIENSKGESRKNGKAKEKAASMVRGAGICPFCQALFKKV